MNPKLKTIYICSECGQESARWQGLCTACNAYNTMEETVIAPKSAQKPGRVPARTAGNTAGQNGAMPLHNIRAAGAGGATGATGATGRRFSTGLGELDNVLSGGIVEGSLVLLGGDPGIGKSTLLLQICSALDKNELSCLYVSGEESAAQVKMRADRLGLVTSNIYIMAETELTEIMAAIERLAPDIVMLDSIQTMHIDEISSAPGSVTQVRECTAQLMRIAKNPRSTGAGFAGAAEPAESAVSAETGGAGPAIIIVGHVTKEGALAGPRVLEHMVDTVLYFEGERRESYRLLRAVKNRFGATNEIGVFEMRETGLAEISNPSAYMLAGRPANVSGSAVTCALEGTRPILSEVQALCAYTQFGTPRRTATGMDYNRVVMLMAVLEKRAGCKLQTYDCYVNVAGGMKILEPAADAAAVAALVSSYKNKPIDPGTIIFGEVGLTGELRAVNMAERRLHEAAKLGFTACVLPQSHLKVLTVPDGIRVYGAANVGEMLQVIL